MRDQKSFSTVSSLLRALAVSMNLINQDMQDHHQRTAYLGYHLGHEMGLGTEELHFLIISALLHDVGTIIAPEKQNIAEIEQNRREIAETGARMIRDLRPFAPIADIILACQNNYRENEAYLLAHGYPIHPVVDIAEAIHLADFISAGWRENGGILNQAARIRKAAECIREKELSDTVMDAFLRIFNKEFIWLDFALNPTFLSYYTGDMHEITLLQTLEVTRLMSRIIDFRSPFTAMHSAGVSASARELAALMGMKDTDCIKMEIAGNLHDVGKLRVPNSILEKPGKLTDEEFNIMREHTYYTYQILRDVAGFEEIAGWAAFHHEKLNGKGYPFHLCAEQLDTGARIMAVADIFSAITEERPYRKPMEKERALKVLHDNVETGGIDGDIVRLLEEHYEQVDAARRKKSAEEGKRYFESKASDGAEGR